VEKWQRKRKKYAFYTSPQLIERGQVRVEYKKLKILQGEAYMSESLKK